MLKAFANFACEISQTIRFLRRLSTATITETAGSSEGSVYLCRYSRP